MPDAACRPAPADDNPPAAGAMCQIPPWKGKKLEEREYLPPSWAGFGFDRDGLLITRSGYRCSPQSLEGALWLVGCGRADARRYLMRSDECAGALRPLYETSDADDTGQVQPTRLRLVEDQKQFGGGKTGDQAEACIDATQSECSEQVTRSRAQTSAAIEPPLQRLRRAAAGQIMFTTSDCEDGVAGATAPTQSLGAFPLI